MTEYSKLYGGCLYELADEEGLTDAMMGELGELRQLFGENPDYIRLLLEMSIPRAERLAMIDQAVGGWVQPYITHFLKLLCENGILQEFGNCCQEFTRRYREDHGMVEAVVTGAVPLSGEQLAALKAQLERMSHKTVMLVEKTDSSILGGLKVELEGKLLDGTIEGRLLGLQKKIDEIIV